MMSGGPCGAIGGRAGGETRATRGPAGGQTKNPSRSTDQAGETKLLARIEQVKHRADKPAHRAGDKTANTARTIHGPTPGTEVPPQDARMEQVRRAVITKQHDKTVPDNPPHKNTSMKKGENQNQHIRHAWGKEA